MSKLKIEAEIKDLKDILCDEDVFYQIPDYQRPYAWDKDNLSDLIDDLFNAYQNNKEEKYFCGSLVLIENEDDKRYDIIDGQQRITTFIIFSCVFRDFYRKDLERKATDFITESIRDRHDDSKRKLTLLTDENYQSSFERKVLKEGIELDDKSNKKPENKYPNNRYLQNAHYLRDFIREKLNEHQVEINNFIEWIFENVVLTTIICPSQDTAIQIFNVLNDRGMPLSSVDILKSSLMVGLSDEDRNTFKSAWGGVVTILENRGLSIEDLFTLYLYYTIASNPKTTLHKGLLENFKDRGSLELIEEIKDFAKSYIDVLTSENKYIYCLKYLRHLVYWQSILTTAKFKNYEHYEDLKKILVAYYYQNWISGATTARVKQTSFNILRMVKDEKPLDKIKQVIVSNLNKYNTTSSFKEELASPYVYGKKWDKSLLFLLEYFSKDSSNQNFIELDTKTQIEHILPQNPKHGSWENFSDDDKEKWTNALGNLTLLSKRKNVQAKNDSFDEKKKVYTKRDNVATSFEITRQLSDYDEWNIENFEERQEELIERLKEILDIF